MRRRQLVRLGLFQLAAGSSSVIFLGVVNRVMAVELGINIQIVSVLLSAHYLGGLLTMPLGHYTDTHPLAGYRRTGYAIGGALVAALCLALSPGVVLWVAANQSLLAYVLGFLFFLLEGVGTAMAGTAFLALLADLTTERERGPASGIAWTLLMVGIIAAGISIGVFLKPYSPAAFISLALAGAVLVVVLVFVALLGQERRVASAARPAGPNRSFTASLRLLLRSAQARWFAAFLLLSLFSFFVQDVLLEPFGGAVFGLSVGVTSRFNAYLGTGVILGMLLGGTVLIPRFGKQRITAVGCWLMAAAFLGLALAGLGGAGLARWLSLAITVLGFGSGVFTVGGVALMTDLTTAQQSGLFAGAWTLARNIATGLASLTGGALVNTASQLGATPGQAYAFVFALEAAGSMISLIFLARVGVQAFQREVASFSTAAAQTMD
jgi:MFS transporter, BCD family, chlorophyll transporter